MAAKRGAAKKAPKDELLVSVNLLIKKLDKFIDIFEEASRHVGEVESTEAKIAALTNKLEILLEQNKSIAQGLILLEKYVRGRSHMPETFESKPPKFSDEL